MQFKTKHQSVTITLQKKRIPESGYKVTVFLGKLHEVSLREYAYFKVREIINMKFQKFLVFSFQIKIKKLPL